MTEYNDMVKVHKVKIHQSDLSKLKKYGSLRVDKYLIKIEDVPIPQVKIFGE